MNAIKLNGGGQVEAGRTTGRLEAERVDGGNTAPQKTPPAPPKVADSISVSERATAINELTARAEQLPDVREERVEQLRALVQAGDYHPAATEIADAILQDEQGATGAI